VTFQDLNITTPLRNALEDIGINTPTPIQEESFSTIMSGKDMVGIAQTGTGKTFAYMLPILRMLKYSEQKNPRVLVLVPTRELVVQVVEEIEKLTAYMNVRITGIYGGVNMNTQHQSLLQGQDIVVATPGRLYDLVLRRALQLKSIQKLVIDEVDVMLDLGFKFQINNIFELLPQNRQNIMFSATITENVENLIEANFKSPQTISVAASGTPLDNIKQTGYKIPNFYTKVNLLRHLLADKETYSKVLIFVAYKRMADRLYAELEQYFHDECTVIHSNKTQNYRLRSIKQFGSGFCRILVATDVMARGLDIESVSHVINFDTPKYPENYMHRIGRTGRAEKEGNSILMTTEAELESLEKIEALMKMEVPQEELPGEIEISSELIPEEQPKFLKLITPERKRTKTLPAPHFTRRKKKTGRRILVDLTEGKLPKSIKSQKLAGIKMQTEERKNNF